VDGADVNMSGVLEVGIAYLNEFVFVTPVVPVKRARQSGGSDLDYSIVKNSKGVVVGTVTSNGLSYSTDGAPS